MAPGKLDSSFTRFVTRGDAAALARVFDLAAPELLRTASYLCADAAEAEDAVQSTFLVAIEKAQDFDRSRPVMPWLVGILATEVRRARERAWRGADEAWLADRVEGPAPSADPQGAAMDSEVRALVERHVDELPETYRAAVRGHLLEGRPNPEAAEQLGISVGALHVRIHRGIRLLRGALPAGAALSAGIAAPSARGLAAIRGEVLGGQAAEAALGAASSAASTTITAASGLATAKGTLVAAAAAVALVGGAFVVPDLLDGGAGRGGPADGEVGQVDTRVAGIPSEDGATPSTERDVLDPRGGAPKREFEGGGGLVLGAGEALDGSSTREAIAAPADRGDEGDAAASGAASTEPELESDEVWLDRFRAAKGYTQIVGVGHRIAELPDDEALSLMQRLYDQLPSPNHRRQILKAFHFKGGTDYAIDILHLGASHGDPSVRSVAFTYVEAYAFENFGGRAGDYAAWRRSVEGRSRGDVFGEAVAGFARELATSSDAEVVARLAAMRPMFRQIARAVGVDTDAVFRGAAVDAIVLRLLTEGEPEDARTLLRWAGAVGIAEVDLRARVLPLVERGQDWALPLLEGFDGAEWVGAGLADAVAQRPGPMLAVAAVRQELEGFGREERGGAARLVEVLAGITSPEIALQLSRDVLVPATGRVIARDDEHDAASWRRWLQSQGDLR